MSMSVFVMILSSYFTSVFSSDMYIFFYPVTPQQPPYHHDQKQSIFIFILTFYIIPYSTQPIFRAVLSVKSFFFSGAEWHVCMLYVHKTEEEVLVFLVKNTKFIILMLL